MNTLNRNSFQAISRRFTNKEIAHQLGVSPSTIGRWKNSKGHIKSRKVSSERFSELRSIALNSKPLDSIREKQQYAVQLQMERADGFELHRIEGEFLMQRRFEYANVLDDIYLFDPFDIESITDKIRFLVDQNNWFGTETYCAVLIEFETRDGQQDEAQTHYFMVGDGKNVIEEHIAEIENEVAEWESDNNYKVAFIMRGYLIDRDRL